jgi:hypothetical protein
MSSGFITIQHCPYHYSIDTTSHLIINKFGIQSW